MPSSFFCGTTAANVWKSVVSVSAAGFKRGRGKGTGRMKVKDFNRGQVLGEGRKKLVLGGLNAPVFQARKFTKLQDVGENPDFEEKITKIRDEMTRRKRLLEMPIERGWSGKRAHGRRAGQPDAHNETSFEGFDSIVLMLRPIQNMTGVLGRTKVMQALVVTGNKNGLAGFADTKGKDARAVVRHARNLATQNLVYIPRWDNHTVMHDFFSKYYDTTVFVERKPRGYGINAHRVTKAICEMFGITDIKVTVEGVTRNQINMTKAFFLGLMNQKEYGDIANEKQLHLVELREENYFYPEILASPEGYVKTDDELSKTGENLDFTYYIYEGKIKQVKPIRRNWYEGNATWYKHLDRIDLMKNREKTKLELAAKYDNTRVLDVFPYFKSNATSFKEPGEEDEKNDQVHNK